MAGEVLQVGEFAAFRWVDDTPDQRGMPLFIGMILEVEYPESDVPQDDGCCTQCGTRLNHPTYKVLCTDGIERNFMDHDQTYPNSHWSEEKGHWLAGPPAWTSH